MAPKRKMAITISPLGQQFWSAARKVREMEKQGKLFSKKQLELYAEINALTKALSEKNLSRKKRKQLEGKLREKKSQSNRPRLKRFRLTQKLYKADGELAGIKEKIIQH